MKIYANLAKNGEILWSAGFKSFFPIQNLKTFDIAHTFLPLTIAKLSTLKNSLIFWPTMYILDNCNLDFCASFSVIALLFSTAFIYSAKSCSFAEYLETLYVTFWMAFTRPAITPPKVNRFGWNLEICQPNVGGWPWQTLGAIRAAATVWEGDEKIVFFGQVNNARFHKFPVGQFLRILHTTTLIGVAM